MYIISEEMKKHLMEKACFMLSRSYIPYSHFAVGAALLAEDDQIFTGCNVENAGFSGTNCAERTAVFKAVSEGVRTFKAIAIVGGKDRKATEECAPCGVCRQVLREFVDPKEFVILLGTGPDDIHEYTLEELLPKSFGPENLT